MDRQQTKIDSSHDRMTFDMQGAAERDLWQRVFPDPVPSTHRLAYQWIPKPGARPELGAMRLEVWPEAIAATVTTTAAAPVEPPKPATPPITQSHNAALREQLEAMDEANFVTRAAELGVQFPRGGRPQSKAQRIATVLNHVAQQKAPKPQGE